MLSDSQKRKKEHDEASEEPKVLSPSSSSANNGGLFTANRLVFLLFCVAVGVAVFGLTRSSPSRAASIGTVEFYEEDRAESSVTTFQPWPHAIPLIGKHWIFEAEGCDGGVLNDEALMVKIVRDAVAAANASLVTIISKEFDHMGVTILALLSESHVGIHTWPQYGYAAVDVFTCGNIAQPQVAIAYMAQQFKANETKSRYVFLHRGGLIASSDLRTLEENNDNKELIAYVKTQYQKAHIFWTEINGLHFFLDGTTQSVESDEHIYHESLVHPAMFSHPNPKNVVILGGAEGAVLREVLTHSTVETATMVELDGEVVALCREFMPTWNDGAFDDHRANLVIAEGKEYVENKVSDNTVDVLIMDVVDPVIGVANEFPMYSASFFKTVQSKLTANGVLVLQAGQMDEDEELGIPPFAKLLADLHSVFPFVSYYTKYVRSFDGLWGYIIACQTQRCNDSPVVNPEASPAIVDKLVADRIVQGHILTSFDGEANRGMFSVNKENREALSKLEDHHTERTISHM